LPAIDRVFFIFVKTFTWHGPPRRFPQAEFFAKNAGISQVSRKTRRK
jgi:hypothetical protein